jgi:hypothetical protein
MSKMANLDAELREKGIDPETVDIEAYLNDIPRDGHTTSIDIPSKVAYQSLPDFR